MTTTETGIVELKPCPFCATPMHQHQHCFSHPRPATGDCLLRQYSFGNEHTTKWNTRAIAAMPDTQVPADAESIARLFHETYELLAPQFGYETRKASAVPWERVPENNRALMIAVARVVSAAALEAQSQLLQTMAGALDSIANYWPHLIAGLRLYPEAMANVEDTLGAIEQEFAALAQYREHRS